MKKIFELVNFKELLKGFLLIFLYMFVIPNLIVLLFHTFHLDISNTIYYILAYVFIYIITLLMIFIVFRDSIFKEAKLYAKNFKKDFGIGIRNWLAAFAFMIFTNLLVVSLAGGIATNEEANRSMISVMPVFSVISMAIVGPFIEEVLFRKGFRKAFKNDKAFMIFTALLFGGAHLLSAINLGTAATNPAQLLYIIPYGGLGYFFAKSYVETDTIFTSVVTHILHNSLSVFLILLVGAGV